MVAELTSEPGGQGIELSSLGLAIAEHSPLPMAAVEGAGHIVRYVNSAFGRLVGKCREQLVGKSFAEMLPQKDQCVTLLDRVYRTGKSENHTEPERSKPHPVFWAYTMWPLMAKEHPVGVMIQVTETGKFHERTLAMNEALLLGSVRQHELTEAAENLNAQLRLEIKVRTLAEKALHQARTQLTDRAGQLEGLVAERTAELTRTNEQLEAFVYSIAHDLRAPLRAMQGFSVMLAAEAGVALNETGRSYLDRIDKSAQFMDALLIDLLAFSRVSQQRVELSSVELKPVVESVLSRLQTDIEQHHARLENSGPWPAVRAHEPTLAQVLFNLVSNALKFVTRDVSAVVRLRTEAQGDFIRVWVEDNGPGIAPEHQGQIFRLFTRLEGEKYVGTGVGLAIVQKGVERMGGQVGVESIPGQGSRFWFELKPA